MTMSASSNLEPHGEVIAPNTLRIERLLPGPIERVWSYLTDPEKRALWFAAGAMEPRAGGRMELIFNHATLSAEETPEKYKKYAGVPRPGQVTRWEPPRVLAFTWGPEGPRQSEVIFELSEQGDRVRLVLTHRRLPDRKEMVGVSGGWHAHLAMLMDRLEDREPRGFWSTHGPLNAEYEARIPQDSAG